ncbi:MAG: hypothetical protein M0R74_18890 [Dehalococcoidia bacterium]|nr:hypothetical protein [Dehalococcoidia bacterium]
MKNTLGDLNNHLFMQLERLNDEDLKDEALEMEIKRAKAVTYIASQLIAAGTLALNAQKFISDGLNQNEKLPPMLEANAGGDKT